RPLGSDHDQLGGTDNDNYNDGDFVATQKVHHKNDCNFCSYGCGQCKGNGGPP
ncbi:unnamed protein product, partial [Dovyalis caffra]